MLASRVSRTLRRLQRSRLQRSALAPQLTSRSSSQVRSFCASSAFGSSPWIHDGAAAAHASSLAITISGKALRGLLNKRGSERDDAPSKHGALHGSIDRENHKLKPPWILYGSNGKENDALSGDSASGHKENDTFPCKSPSHSNENDDGRFKRKEGEAGMSEAAGFFSCNGCVNGDDGNGESAAAIHCSSKQTLGKDDIMSFLKECFESGGTSEDVILANEKFFPFATAAFQTYFLENFSVESQKELENMDVTEIRQKVIFPMFVNFCTDNFPQEMKRFKNLLEASNMTKPHSVFTSARSMKRKIIYHYGPTNSGKTYNALQRFLQEPSGIYCSPLRLLAMEVYDFANSKGVLCNLITGQERKENPFSNHVSCTVEMASIQNVWKVAVIDEVQLLNDENRGWAWTRALLGLQAEEIHLCGDPSALCVVRNICLATGDELRECSYERFKPLAVDTNTLNGSFSNVEAGDCIVAFSRREIFEIKRAVERATQKPCCVVYGALPPETRAQQAKLFNEPGSGYDVLVASDAIGMGLNLNIRRVVFHTLEKFNGELMNNIPASLIKQIAGRAGRRGSLYPEGLVTTFHLSDLPHLQLCLEQPFVDACNAGLFPSCEQLQIFADHMPNVKFSELLERFIETSRVDAYYFLCKNKDLMKIASVIDTVDSLTLEERFTFCFSPVSARDAKSVGALLHYARSYSKRIPLQLLIGRPSSSPAIDFQLMDLEDKYKLISLYLWLSQHFPPELFPDKQEGENMSMAIAQMLGQSLTDLHKSTG